MFFESLIEDFLAFFLDSCFYCSTGFTVNYIRSEGVLKVLMSHVSCELMRWDLL